MQLGQKAQWRQGLPLLESATPQRSSISRPNRRRWHVILDRDGDQKINLNALSSTRWKIALTEQSQIPINQYRNLAVGILGQMVGFLGTQVSDNSFSRTRGGRVTNFLIPICNAYIDQLKIINPFLKEDMTRAQSIPRCSSADKLKNHICEDNDQNSIERRETNCLISVLTIATLSGEALVQPLSSISHRDNSVLQIVMDKATMPHSQFYYILTLMSTILRRDHSRWPTYGLMPQHPVGNVAKLPEGEVSQATTTTHQLQITNHERKWLAS